jgi:hypothetical protein
MNPDFRKLKEGYKDKRRRNGKKINKISGNKFDSDEWSASIWRSKCGVRWDKR